MVHLMTEEETEASERLHIPPHVGTCAHMHAHTLTGLPDCIAHDTPLGSVLHSDLEAELWG